MLRRLALFSALLVAVGCDSADVQQQQIFEQAAFNGASDGVTADDWQIAPFFRISMQVTLKPEPNPAAPSEFVALQVFASEAAGTLTLYRRDFDGTIRPIPGISPENGPGAYTFSFAAGNALQTVTPGSVRLIVLDGLGRVITYGDLVLR